MWTKTKTKTKTRTRIRTRNLRRAIMKKTNVLLVALLVLAANTAFARDEFDEIVSHIESHYHVRHNHGFLMAVAGLVVNVSHVGVKGVRTAIFDDQQLIGSSDREFDEVMRKTLKGGWQPVVRHYSRRSGECTYIYARTEGKELKVLVANLEPNEAVVFEARINPKKLEEFINEHSSPSKQQFRMRHDKNDDNSDESAQLSGAPDAEGAR